MLTAYRKEIQTRSGVCVNCKEKTDENTHPVVYLYERKHSAYGEKIGSMCTKCYDHIMPEKIALKAAKSIVSKLSLHSIHDLFKSTAASATEDEKEKEKLLEEGIASEVEGEVESSEDGKAELEKGRNEGAREGGIAGGGGRSGGGGGGGGGGAGGSRGRRCGGRGGRPLCSRPRERRRSSRARRG
jgi:uncharacterized membrane protein YgcG